MIRAVAKYRKSDPDEGDETELVENLFHILCFAMNENPDNQVGFAKAEGLQLMLNMIKRKRYAKIGSIKTLDFALTKCLPNCEKFIDGSGLKTLFSVFMGKGLKKKAFKKETTKIEEHVISVISQLFMNVADVRYYRLLKKFQENDYEKVERLVELFEEYYRKLEDAERRFQAEKKFKQEEKQEEEEKKKGKEEEDEERLLRRIEAGLFTLQLIAFLLGFVSTSGDAKLRERVTQLLNQKDSSLDTVKTTLQEYCDQMGPAKTKVKMKNILESVIAML